MNWFQYPRFSVSGWCRTWLLTEPLSPLGCRGQSGGHSAPELVWLLCFHQTSSTCFCYTDWIERKMVGAKQVWKLSFFFLWNWLTFFWVSCSFSYPFASEIVYVCKLILIPYVGWVMRKDTIDMKCTGSWCPLYSGTWVPVTAPPSNSCRTLRKSLHLSVLQFHYLQREYINSSNL